MGFQKKFSMEQILDFSELAVTSTCGVIVAAISWLVIYVAFKKKTLKSPNTMAVLDILISGSLNSLLANIFVVLSSLDRTKKNFEICLTSIILSESFQLISNMGIILMSIIRLFKVISSKRYKIFTNYKITLIIFLSKWILCFLFSIITDFSYHVYLGKKTVDLNNFRCNYSSVWSKSQGIIHILLFDLVPISVIVIIHAVLFKKVRKVIMKTRSNVTNDNTKKDLSYIRKKTLYASLFLAFTRIVFTFPSTILNIIALYNSELFSKIHPALITVIHWIYFFYTIVESIIVITFSKDILNDIKSIIFKKRHTREDSNNSMKAIQTTFKS